jgi:hypothetical protein
MTGCHANQRCQCKCGGRLDDIPYDNAGIESCASALGSQQQLGRRNASRAVHHSACAAIVPPNAITACLMRINAPIEKALF